MSDTPNPVEPIREIIAPRHESLAKEFEGDIGPRPLEFGEGRIWLVAKDPHTLFAYWEFIPAQHPEAVGVDGEAHFYLRILDESGNVEREVHIQTGDANVHAGVARADSAYTAELGFYSRSGVWCFIGKSGTAYTPPEGSPPDDEDIRFATIPGGMALPSSKLTGKSLIRISRRTRWTVEQERRFVELLAEDVKSGGVPEGRTARARAKLHARPGRKPIPAAFLAELDDSAPSSPAKHASGWNSDPVEDINLHVNAEIIVYGGTSPNNSVTIAGVPPQLRHDGTFRLHARMPDGDFEIPIVVTSPDGKHTRRATLRFSRETIADAGVSATPQPDYLPPSPPGALPPG
ncbi:MAG: hypothetical protein RL088_3502 [Verrucomicrobiota bacterium]|jgi:hypothetical protein